MKKYQNALKVLKDQLQAEREFSRRLEEHLKHLLSDSKGMDCFYLSMNRYKSSYSNNENMKHFPFISLGELVSLAHLGLTRMGQKNLKAKVMNSFLVEEVEDLVEENDKRKELEGVEELSTDELMRENNALVQVLYCCR